MASKTISTPVEPPPKKKWFKSKKLLLAILVTALVALAGAFIVYQHKLANAQEEEFSEDSLQQHAAQHDKFSAMESEFFALGKYTTNLKQPDTYIQTELFLEIKTHDNKAKEQLKHYLPVIQHHILLSLTSRSKEQMFMGHEKEALAQEIFKTVNDVIPTKIKEEVKFVQVLYGNLIVQ